MQRKDELINKLITYIYEIWSCSTKDEKALGNKFKDYFNMTNEELKKYGLKD